MAKRELVSLLCLSSWCLVIVTVLWIILTVPWVGLQCVIVVFTDYTHLLFVCLILYVPSTIFQLLRDGSIWVEPVLS